MPKPATPNITVSTFTSSGKVHPQAHKITVYGDYSVFDETLGKFINSDTLVRK